MLKAISSALPAIHESSYTVVDVKFEAGAGGPMDQDMMSHYEPSNHNYVPGNRYDEEDNELQTPNSSPPSQENFNKRKRSVPKKFSIDEDENPLSAGGQDLTAVVKTECVDYTQQSYEDIAAPEQGALTGYGQDWDDTTVDQIDINRVNAQKINSKQRDDCPICGDKANGLHYGVYTCEGCKNFFKRSVVMTQKKPYICNNQNNCDVRIVIDMSGIKRKGARCQACRYTACLDAGMYHSGYPRSRGGRHNSRGRGGSHPTDWNEMIASHHHQSGHHHQQHILEAPMTQNKKPRIVAPPRKASSKEGHETPSDYLDYENNSSWDNSVTATDFQDFSNLDTSSNRDIHSNNISNTSEELLNNSNSLFENVFKDELEKERSKNRDLTSRLVEKDKQLKLTERQMENMKRHMMISQTLAGQQQEEIKQLKNEINRLTVFRSTVRNYRNSSGLVNGSEELENESEGVMIDPDMVSVSFNE